MLIEWLKHETQIYMFTANTKTQMVQFNTLSCPPLLQHSKVSQSMNHPLHRLAGRIDLEIVLFHWVIQWIAMARKRTEKGPFVSFVNLVSHDRLTLNEFVFNSTRLSNCWVTCCTFPGTWSPADMVVAKGKTNLILYPKAVWTNEIVHGEQVWFTDFHLKSVQYHRRTFEWPVWKMFTDVKLEKRK